MKFIFTSLMFVFCSIHVSAQKFGSGWVTTLKGDTIKGFIEKDHWGTVNPESIRFKNQAGEVTTYYPYQITYFGLSKGNYYYKSAITLIDNNLKDEIINGKVYKKAILDTMFLTVMFKDKLSLYKTTTVNDKKHYYIEKDGNLFELVETYSMVLDPSDNLSKLSTTSNYLGIFNSLTLDCPKMGKKLRQLKLTDSSLLQAVLTYNFCISGTSPKYYKPKKEIDVRWGAIIGLSATKMKFIPQGGYLYTETRAMASNNFPVSFNPTFGLSALIGLPGKRKVSGINTELVYYRTSSEAGGYKETFPYLRLNLAYRYTFGQKKISPFIQAGFSKSLILGYSFNELVDPNGYRDANSAPLDIRDRSLRVIESGAFLGFGLLGKHMTGEIRFERSNGASGVPNLKSPFTSGYLLLTYRIGRTKKE